MSVACSGRQKDMSGVLPASANLDLPTFSMAVTAGNKGVLDGTTWRNLVGETANYYLANHELLAMSHCLVTSMNKYDYGPHGHCHPAGACAAQTAKIAKTTKQRAMDNPYIPAFKIAEDILHGKCTNQSFSVSTSE